MDTEVERLSSNTLGALHREVIVERERIAGVLSEALRLGVVLTSGVDERRTKRSAVIVSLQRAIALEVHSGEYQEGSTYLFSFELEGHRYYFSADVTYNEDHGWISVDSPTRLYCVERRGCVRKRLAEAADVSVHVGPRTYTARALDLSETGFGLAVQAGTAEQLPDWFRLSGTAITRPFAHLRHSRPLDAAQGWVRLGVSTSAVPSRVRVVETEVDEHELVGSGTGYGGVRGLQSRLVEIPSHHGNEMRGVLDWNGRLDGAVAFLVPSAWGQTKESVSPLALSLLATATRLKRSAAVLRYDGTNRAGESYIPHECREPGREHLNFTFSRAAREVQDAVRYLSELTRSQVVIASVSLSAVEVRKAISLDGDRVSGWVSLVGVADLQSTLRAVSGGVDYQRGLEEGVEFGCQEILGVLADIDSTGRDALRSGLATLEDARADMARIRAPIVWIHGEHDAWIDYAAVRELLTCGSQGSRRLIRVPTGHRLHSGTKALAVFRLAAGEAASLAFGETVEGVAAERRLIVDVREKELARVGTPGVDRQQFWKDYLLGKRRIFGMELLCRSSAYREFIGAEVGALGEVVGAMVLDLGAGLGAIADDLRESRRRPGQLVEVDVVREALKRRDWASRQNPFGIVRVNADADSREGCALPFKNESFDAAVASLVIGYLADYQRTLREMHRVLRRGGRLVVSSLDHDSDPSLLYEDGIEDFITDESRAVLTGGDSEAFKVGVRDFLNSGAQLFRLVEAGAYRFFSADELERALSELGFSGIESRRAMGMPPQAVIVSGVRT